jgi:hypothetical protein
MLAAIINAAPTTNDRRPNVTPQRSLAALRCGARSCWRRDFLRIVSPPSRQKCCGAGHGNFDSRNLCLQAIAKSA